MLLMRMPSRQRGLSLIELVVTMSLLAFLLFAVMPSMASWIRTLGVRNAAESVQAGLVKARMEALRRNRVVTLWLVSQNAAGSLDGSCVLKSDSAAWVVSIDDPSGSCGDVPSPDTAPRIVDAAPAGSTSRNTVVAAVARDGSTAASSVSFNAYGQVLQTGAQIASVDFTPTTAGTGARHLRVTVSTAGSIRMCDVGALGNDPSACP